MIHTPRTHKRNNSSRYKKQTRINVTHKQRHDRIKPDTCWGEPPSGEPVEPRTGDFSTALRTQSPQSQEWQTNRSRNTKRGLRNVNTITIRKESRKEHTRNRRRDRRKIKSATNKQEWRGLVRHATTQLNRSTQTWALQGRAKSNNYPTTHNISKTTYIRKLTEDASIPNKLKERIVPTKIPYKRKNKIAIFSVRGMKESAKREQIIQQMVRHNIDIACIQETNIPNSCSEARDSHTFIFSSDAPHDKEDWGVGFCYKRTFEKYRTNYLQISGNIATMELSMHGNPLVIISCYLPHDAVLQHIQPKRTAAWEELQDTISKITEAKNIVVCGDFNAALHHRKVKKT